MITVRKRVVALCLSTCLTGLFTACDSGSGENKESQTAVVTDEPTGDAVEENMDTATEAPAAAPAAATGDTLLATGEKLYTANCPACHTLTKDKLIGPGLAGVTKRRSEEWLIKWIKNSQQVIASGDKDAVALFNEYNKMIMPPYNYTDAEIKGILAYIEKNQQP